MTHVYTYIKYLTSSRHAGNAQRQGYPPRPSIHHPPPIHPQPALNRARARGPVGSSKRTSGLREPRAMGGGCHDGHVCTSRYCCCRSWGRGCTGDSTYERHVVCSAQLGVGSRRQMRYMTRLMGAQWWRWTRIPRVDDAKGAGPPTAGYPTLPQVTVRNACIAKHLHRLASSSSPSCAVWAT